MSLSPQTPPFQVAALYRFCPLDGLDELRASLAAFCCGRAIKGTLLIAREGVNGTVAGSEAAISALVALLESVTGSGLSVKYATAAQMPFHRLKVRIKREIVTMGVEGLDPLSCAGTNVEPEAWNALIADPDTVVIDTRNDYEVRVGTFAGAIDPATKTFREMPDWIERHRHELAGRKVAMFCTGGIRCEKATAFAKAVGIDEVFHLKGGILNYLEKIPAAESLWQGECFVFDERVAVSHGLAEGSVELCRACRVPLTPEGRLSPKYRLGVSCDECHDLRSQADRARYAERQRQMELAAARGELHIGSI